jgi:hypothetical protein
MTTGVERMRATGREAIVLSAFVIGLLPLAVHGAEHAQAAGRSTGLLLSVIAIIVIAAIVAARARSFAGFVPVLAGLAVLFALCVLAVEAAVRQHWIDSGGDRLLIADAVFVALLLVPLLVSWLRRRSRKVP